MSISVKECLVVDENTVVGPFDKIEEVNGFYRVWEGEQAGICSGEDASEILPIEWDFIDVYDKFFRVWKNSLYGIFDFQGNKILDVEWYTIRVHTDIFVAIDQSNKEYHFDHHGNPI